jgi:acyl-CoA ligase (AMP-forming) (exosortase A-associated)
MPYLLHETLFETAGHLPDREALTHDRSGAITFESFAHAVRRLAGHFIEIGVRPNDRVAVYLSKVPLAPVAYYAATLAGGVFVPLNPVLKAPQVAHILRDCAVKIFVTSPERFEHLGGVVAECTDLRHVLFSEAPPDRETLRLDWSAWDQGSLAVGGSTTLDDPPRRVDNDMSAILYTSGSTGKPKGVIISHRNVVSGAQSVSQYLEISTADRLLALLPFSFDYGLNQLTSAVLKGGACVLFDYLLARDVIKAVVRHEITGLAAVPPLWAQLAPLEWPDQAVRSLRYITNSGGAMPEKVLDQLRRKLPNTAPYLMYGLTEAFRSTYLPPDKVDERKGSMGKAIPNAEILVVGKDGRAVGPNEPGELIHRGALVALGYWNDPERTAERFKPVPSQPTEIPSKETAVWSGDTVRYDEDGYLYFIGREDGMIKTSGYRVSPEEIEEIAYATGEISAAAAIGARHEILGQGIVLIVCRTAESAVTEEQLLEKCKQELANFMVPLLIVFRDEMPHNPNGKINRRRLAEEYADVFA